MHIIEGFPVEKTFDVVLVGEAFEAMEFVLERAFLQVAGDAYVERAGETGHDVDIVGFAFAWHWVE